MQYQALVGRAAESQRQQSAGKQAVEVRAQADQVKAKAE
jgi:hypothetical protein